MLRIGKSGARGGAGLERVVVPGDSVELATGACHLGVLDADGALVPAHAGALGGGELVVGSSFAAHGLVVGFVRLAICFVRIGAGKGDGQCGGQKGRYEWFHGEFPLHSLLWYMI